ncbi:hypothetical protein ASL14_23400 [Paenibacillus sp. IHB B 3084]|uniref:hypothetical protein n=1 Tax=Paenibacillus sp. IHB B 3084 TaxID=867076 RepID=UPI000720A427|nr:hypothetical protein [Paenibacillus sp. IHB B 3084]ALP38679.1 hypothetical protein ASL14_23400 [Paenibacillus sp. IHB B 3084]
MVKEDEALRVPFDLTIAVASGFFDDMFKGENPEAKANATLLQIQMDRCATDRLKSNALSGSESNRKDLKRA